MAASSTQCILLQSMGTLNLSDLVAEFRSSPRHRLKTYRSNFVEALGEHVGGLWRSVAGVCVTCMTESNFDISASDIGKKCSHGARIVEKPA